MYWYELFVYATFGLVIGSFLNVCIYRIPLHIPIWKGRSFCPNCHHELHAKDLFPVFSWLLLQGKCRYCGSKISIRYPFVETLNMLLWIGCYIVYENSLYTILLCLYASILICLAFTDIDTMEVPSSYLIGLVFIGCAARYFVLGQLMDGVFGFIVAYLPLVAVYYLTKGAIGGGDVRLLGIAGILLGIKGILFAMMLGYVLAAICLIPSMLKQQVDGKTPIPMVPYFAVTIYFVALFGQPIIQWYFSFL